MIDPTDNVKAGQVPPRMLVSRLLRDRTGASAIEFAILAFPFLLLVFAILELCVMVAAQQFMTNATDDLARYVSTGQNQNNDDMNDVEDAVGFLCGRMEILFPSGCPDRLVVVLESVDSFKDAAAQFDGKGVPPKSDFNPGGGLTINVLRVYYPWPVITDIMRERISNLGDGNTLLFATNTWRNEPY